MNDDKIGRELRRRSDSVSLDADWVQRELLPAVNSGISTRPVAARASGLPALAGLVAVLVVLAVLVFAAPRSAPTPAASSETQMPYAHAPSTSSRLPEATLPTMEVTPAVTSRPQPGTVAPREVECASARQTPTTPYTWRPTVILDETGLVESCTVVEPPEDDEGYVVVTNPGADLRALQVVWGSHECDAEATFVFRRTDDWFSLHGESPHDGCAREARHSIALALLDTIEASSVAGSFRGATANYPKPPIEPSVIECPYGAGGQPVEVSLVDHSGLALSCEGLFDPLKPTEPVSAMNVGSDERQLEIRWQISAECDPVPARLELWGPLVYDLPFAQGPEFVVEIDEQARLPAPQDCQSGVATQGVRIGLASPISADRAVLEAFRTKSGMGYDIDQVDGHSLTMTLTSAKTQYAVGEPIDVSVSIIYDGPRKTIAMSGLSGNPGFGFHQLDGDVRQTEGTDWTCHDLELRRGIPRTAPFRKAGIFIPDDFPNSEAENAYWSDPELRLGPGIYRIFASAGGVVDGFCWGGGDVDHPSLSVRGSVVIEVR